MPLVVIVNIVRHLFATQRPQINYKETKNLTMADSLA